MSSPNVPSVYMGLQLKESNVVIYLNHLSFTFGVLRKKIQILMRRRTYFILTPIQ